MSCDPGTGRVGRRQATGGVPSRDARTAGREQAPELVGEAVAEPATAELNRSSPAKQATATRLRSAESLAPALALRASTDLFLVANGVVSRLAAARRDESEPLP